MIIGRRIQYCITFLLVLLVIGLYTTAGRAEAEVKLSKGQTFYVPVYSHIYTGPKSHPTKLTAIVSIRNTDMVFPITLVAVDYYDSDGKLVRKYLTEDVRLSALASTRFIVNMSDKRGGSGANFIVKWRSKDKVNTPIVESIMIGSKGMSFVSRGQVIKDKSE